MMAWQGTKNSPINAPEYATVGFPDFVNSGNNPYAKQIKEGLPFKEIVRDGDQLYLRVASSFDVGREKLTVVTSEPLDQSLLSDIAANLGEITLYAAGINFGEERNDEHSASSVTDNPGKVDGS